MLKPNNTHCNAEEMLRVRSLILDAPDSEFNMGSFCGTARCIAGWAVSRAASELEGGIKRAATRVLGLSAVQADRLFLPKNDNGKYDGLRIDGGIYSITREKAAQAIDNVIADGMPHWQDILA